MRTKILSLKALTALVILASCSPKTYLAKNQVADEQPDGGSYTEKTVPVVTKVAPDGEVTLRFYESLPDVAYISAADFQSIVLPGSTMTVTHTGVGEYTLVNGDATTVVDINKDVFVSSDFEAFTNQMGLLQAGMDNVYYDGMPFVRYKGMTSTPATSTVTLDLGKYGIDIHADGKGTVWFPFATLADIYTDLYYHHAGFNGEKVVVNTSVNEVDLTEIDPDYYAPLMASMERPESMADFAYRELCFAMDNFYGYPGRIACNDAIKEKGLDRALEEDITCGQEIKALLHSRKLTEYFIGMAGLTGVFFDGHTSLEIMGMAMGRDYQKYSGLISEYSKLQAEHQDLAQATQAGIMGMMGMMTDAMAIRKLRPEAYGTDETYIKKGKTAVCVFDSFNSRNEQAWKDYYAGKGPKPTLENTPGDDMVIFLDALQKAQDDPEVENLVIDITANGGGSADIVLAMTSLIIDKSYICFDNPLTGRRSIADYEVDRNFDGVFDEKDKDVHYDLNFAVLTSDVSFSCGNLFPSILKDAGIPVMGETSGGGSCAIQAMCTADGFCFQISSFRARLNDLEGRNIDPGITPDIPIEITGTYQLELSEEWAPTVKDYKDFYDIDKLTSLLETYRSK